MNVRRGELILLLAMVALLIGLTVVTVQNQSDDDTNLLSGTTYSNGPTGGRALYLWLDELEYDVRRWEPFNFNPAPLNGVLWIVDPMLYIDSNDSQNLEQWVEQGGTAVVIQDYLSQGIADAFAIEEDGFITGGLYPVAPWLGAAGQRYDGNGSYILPKGALPLLASDSGAVGAFYLPYGDGELWYFGTSEPFQNRALLSPENGVLVQGLLAQLPADVPHHFDEYHHGFEAMAMGGEGLGYQMTRQPWGWGIFYAVGFTFMYLILRGRRFGRPIPLPNEHWRRQAGEYVEGMAWLYRRSRLRQPILRHYYQRFRRTVTERYRLPVATGDEQFVAHLQRARPDLDGPALRRHLHALQNPKPADRDMVTLARDHATWVQKVMG